MADEGDYIRSLIEEARGMKVKPLPSAISLAWNHPGILGHAVDSEKEWADDQRKAFVLKRLSEKYPYGQGIGDPTLRKEVMSYEDGNLSHLDTPYHFRGYTTPGSPFNNVTSYMSSYPSMAYNASAMAANAVDPAAPFDPEAGKKFAASANTALAYLPEAVGLVPKGTRTYADAANDAAYARQEAPWDAAESAKKAYNDYTQAAASQDADAMYTDGREHYMRQGVPEVPAMFAGAFTDSFLDPYAGWMSAAKLARQGQKARALKGVGWEWGLGQTMAGISALEQATRPTSMLQTSAR